MIDLIWLTIALPLLGVLINGLFGRQLGRTMNGIIGAGTVVLAFIVSLLVSAQVSGLPDHNSATVKLWDWVTIGSFDVSFSLLVDPLSMMMALIVTGVGALIHIYAIGYMDHDKDVSRFFTYLNLFIASMLILVLSDNYLGLYMGWELVGVCSYLLIGFWFTRPAAADAGKKAFIVNRVGDFGFALGVFLIWTTFGTLNYHQVFALAPEAAAGAITAITALLFVGAIGKSAQIPLHVWLPDAMEGPTPVSALIHAATMVTAGIYMVVRSNALYSLAPQVSMTVAIIGGLTAFFAATIALVQYDLKRVLAYSTISQLGYMVLAVGVGAYTSAMFHLMTHAFFKALLFLGAGSVMHAMNNVIDMRRFGGLKDKMRITYITFLIGGLALAGFPLITAGFYSKDEILANVYDDSLLLELLALLTALLTAFYTFRAVFMTFHGQPKDRTLYDHAHENKPVMTVPLIILAVLSLLGGYIGLPASLQLPNFLERWLDPVSHAEHNISLATEIGLLLVSSILALVGIGLAYWVYRRRADLAENEARLYGPLYKVLVNKYYVDEFYDMVFVRPGKRVGKFLAGIIDVGLIDTLLVDGSARLTGAFGRIFAGFQTGYLRNYVMSILIGCIIVGIYFFVR